MLGKIQKNQLAKISNIATKKLLTFSHFLKRPYYVTFFVVNQNPTAGADTFNLQENAVASILPILDNDKYLLMFHFDFHFFCFIIKIVCF